MTTKKPNLNDIPQFTTASYAVDIPWDHLEHWLKEHEPDFSPDFQREHVWDVAQKSRYIEFILRGGKSGTDVYFNQPGWNSGKRGHLVCVDGKQRIHAALDFLQNKIPAFGHKFQEYEGRLRINTRFRVHVNDLKSHQEVLQWYLDLNTGGTPHSNEEIRRVQLLLESAKTRTQEEKTFLNAQVARLPSGYFCRVVEDDRKNSRVKIRDSHRSRTFWVTYDSLQKNWRFT
jgi:hypothetical protein